MSARYTQAEARSRILTEFSAWAKQHGKQRPNGTDGLIFFGYLQREETHLMSFRCSGDPWQTVHAWLLGARLVSD